MASNIKFKRSAVQNRVPTTAQLDLGELALNTYDGKLYTEINTGSAAVIEIGSKLSSLVVDGANGGGGGDVVFHGTTAGRDLTWDYSEDKLNFKDNVKLELGNNPSDLFLVHNGTYSQIAGIGDFFIQSNSLYLKDYTNGHNYLKAIRDGAVDLYHDNTVRVTTTADGADISGTGSLKIPVGTTAQRSGSPTAGDLRYNSTTSSFEGYSSDWGDIGAGGIGVGSDASNPRTGIIQNRVGVGFTDLNIVGAGISVTGYGTTVFVDFNEFKPGSFHRTIHNYTATAGQTTFAGLNYAISEKQIAVYLNGARLSEATYTATSGTTVVLDVGASVGDEVEIVNIHTNSDVDRKVNTYTATAGQTTFTGLSYNSRQELDVYLNGIRLATADYTATSGSTVVLAVGASVNDIVDIVSTGDGVSFRSTTDASGDRFTLNNVGIGQETTPDALNVTGNVKVVGVLTATTLHGDGQNLTNTGSSLSEPSSGTQRLVTTSLTTGTMTSSGTGSELAFDYSNNELEFSDNTKALFGTGGDLAIYHSGSHSFIDDTGTGNLKLRSNNFRVSNADESKTSATFVPSGAVELYHNHSKKFETTSTGASVTGNLAVSGVLTYDDVTSVDSVGIITARAGLVVSGGTVTIPTVAGTNTNASLNVLFQTAAGVIDGGSALTYNPAQDVLSVNGNHISSQTFRGDGALGTLTCDNHSSTTAVAVSNTIDITTVDNATDAFTLKQGSNEYITVDTNNSSELITLGNTTTNPNISLLAGNVTISGNLTVTGTTTQNNTVATSTKVFTLASGSANDAAADGGGIAVDSGDGDKTFLWVDATNSWTSSEHIRIPDDTVFGFASDTNTHIGRPAADKLAFTTGGTERVTINNTTGVNTLDTVGGVRATHFVGRSNISTPTADVSIYRVADNTLEFATASTPRLRIHAGGTVETKGELWVGGSTPVLRWRDSTHGEKATARIDGSNADLYFEVANQETLRISSGGIVSWRRTATPLSGSSNSYSVNIYRDGGSGYGYLDTVTSGGNSTGIRIRTYNNTTYTNVLEHTTSKVTNFQTNGLTRLSIASNGQITTRGASGTSFNNAGAGDFGSFLTVNGGHTSNQWGILSLEGNTSANGYAVGAIQFINQNNANGSSGANTQSRLLAKIDVQSVTSDSNAGDDSGGSLLFTTKPEAGNPAERLRITSAGQMVMGATTSKAKFEIKDNGYSSSTVLQRISGDDANPYALIIANDTCNSSADRGLQFFVSDSGTHYIRARGSSTAGNNNLQIVAQNEINFATGSGESQRVRITAGTAVEIGSGTGSGGCGLAVYGGTNNNVSGQDAALYVRHDSNNDWGMWLYKQHEYGFRIDSNNTATLSLAIYDQTNTLKHQFKGNGDYAAAGAIDSASDIKLKTNIKTIDNALDKVLQLRGAEYDRIDRDNQHEIGVIAQEVEKVIPELVHGDETKTVSYGNMTAVLIEAIKEQNEIINRMRKEIDDLKN